MDSPDTHPQLPMDTVPELEDRISLFDVMAATQRVLAENMLNIAVQAAQQETDLKNSYKANQKAIVEKDAAILAGQEEQLKAERFRTHDSLTGLPNKVYLTESLERRIANNKSIGVYSIDILGFKSQINDKLGHPTGDRFLKNWSNYFSVAFSRVSDMVAFQPENQADEESVARTGGDEFYVLSNFDIDEDHDPKQRADLIEGQAAHGYQYIHQVFNEFVASSEWAGSNLAVSVGYAISQPGDGVTAEELIEISDARMYDEKNTQRQAISHRP